MLYDGYNIEQSIMLVTDSVQSDNKSRWRDEQNSNNNRSGAAKTLSQAEKNNLKWKIGNGFVKRIHFYANQEFKWKVGDKEPQKGKNQNCPHMRKTFPEMF